MERGTKLRLIKRTGTFVLATSLIVGAAKYKANMVYPKPVSNVNYSSEIASIMEIEDVSFSNKEVEELVKKETGGKLDKASLDKVDSLSILDKLENSDLSDLKYLPNLAHLIIAGNDVDFSDLRYNTNLFGINMISCRVSNSSMLPNSIYVFSALDVIFLDDSLVLPYYVGDVNLDVCRLKEVVFKSMHNLKNLDISSEMFFDVKSLKDAHQLESLGLKKICNVKNSDYLKKLDLKDLSLDEFSLIWLTGEDLEELPVDISCKSYLLEQEKEISNIYDSLGIKKFDSVEDKLEKITLGLLNRFSYDGEVAENANEAYDLLLKDYNENPFSSFCTNDKGVCINYAALFHSLANRAGIDTYQLFNDVHTWNACKVDGEYKGYDVTYLELGPVVSYKGQLAIVKNSSIEDMFSDGKEDDLSYYGFPLEGKMDDNHTARYYAGEPLKVDDVGYIDEDCISYQYDKKSRKYAFLANFLKYYGAFLLVDFIYNYREQKKLRKQYYLDENEEEYDDLSK